MGSEEPLPLWKTSTLSLCWQVRMTTVQSTPSGCSILDKTEGHPEAETGVYMNYHTLKLIFWCSVL